MKRVMCLYRVSSKKQVDKNTADIPMQRISCRECIKLHPDWVLIGEKEELGVSGSKVSAKKRDGILELQEMAKKREFDVLLVFMFDRIGRIDDETPHIVEWFIRQGIEVWSVKEGEQKLETHSDKLINYIRYWQAAGESQKISMRVSERIRQMLEEGLYTGGSVRYGYNLVDSGLKSKKGDVIKKYVKSEGMDGEAVVALFSLVDKKGLGTYQASDWMNQNGYTYKGRKFTPTTVRRILSNPFYAGATPWGTKSEELERLRLITDDIFIHVQDILNQRKSGFDESRSVGLTMRGKAMLSGNIYCKHCGNRLVTVSYVDTYRKVDGSISEHKYPKYQCYHKARKLCECDGQSAYKAEWVDKAVEGVLQKLFASFGEIEQNEQVKAIVSRRLAETQRKELFIKSKMLKSEKQLEELRKEMTKSLTGDSLYDKEDIAIAITELKGRVKKDQDELDRITRVKDDKERLLEQFFPTLKKVKSWAEEFESASLEEKKMICSTMFKRIEVGKGYEINLVLNTKYEDFFEEWGGEVWGKSESGVVC